MHADSSGLQVTRSSAVTVKLWSFSHGHAEFVLVQTCRDVRMCAGVYVGIHPHGEARLLSEMRGTSTEQLQFAGTLHIEEQNACLQREVNFVGEFADA